MGKFETTTSKGRVVYGRKKHYFRPTDLLRIWRSVKKNIDPEKEISEETKMFFLNLGWDIIKAVEPDAQFSVKKETEQVIVDQIENTIQNISIGLMVEMIEKIPFLPQKYELLIAENIYWSVWHFLNNLLH